MSPGQTGTSARAPEMTQSRADDKPNLHIINSSVSAFVRQRSARVYASSLNLNPEKKSISGFQGKFAVGCTTTTPPRLLSWKQFTFLESRRFET
ncbi:hypothetical protein PoB_004487100 [Plakobranchus ocellatus]|uniref:Uncharacterized protein n=1 Tax=Plakobranchus ocellatus TaxID=259542 RepID=A0AAV4BD85_9GAST|nr:hypothetical protein PoB_004487100 [Plakobranchus ocellatus]